MVFFSASFAALFTAVLSATAVVARPVESTTALAKRDAPAPHWVIYSDKWISGETGPPSVSDIKGYNVFALSFWLLSGPADQAVEWTSLDAATRTSIKTQYNNAGIKMIVSAFGSTDAPTSSGADPTTTANNLAAFVKQYSLDGVDIDYEDFNAINAQDGKAEAWLSTFTTALRAQLPAGDYIISHAPVAPWFSPKYTSGAYLKVNQNVGNLIDWYNIQFYNQGTSEYTTCDGLLTASSSTYPNSAVFQIAASGVDLNKIVIGKPAGTGDANNGFMDASTLAGCLSTAKGKGWDAGVMVWEYPDAAAAWIQTVRSQAFPE
ncbi:glycoside hydrolase family 18 protein [Coniophora puteana RWD-64-598 SS2]|uniref:Glycoside hydrolase family 18 protein n=1 Tax=Coniophora puteana (strain RWD-64-598) TaxID=741705 RepID=A0A5M3MJU1_CONPW|nr:glycoside hydrolase family 18 protein [Coniophora puteana RWD-64-598 SS2]EIW79383.1 glycoside hydrolase family 18 protein [Coniophora puteana RWD-64-598 SS2]